MGSLVAHIIAGCPFLVYGVWWTIISFWTSFQLRPDSKKCLKSDRYARCCQYDRGLSHMSWIPQPFCRRIPLEPILKILFSLVGVIIEEFFVYNSESPPHITMFVYTPIRDGHFAGVGKLQHIIVYSAFLTSGVVDLLSLCLRHFPGHASQLFLVFAFLIQVLLFYFHASTSEDSVMIFTVHWIFTLVASVSLVFAALRMLYSSNLFVNTGLAYSITLQGTWLVQGGYLMFPPDRNKPWLILPPQDGHGNSSHASGHEAAMFTAACLGIHILGLALLLLVVWYAVRRLAVRYIARDERAGKGQALQLQVLSTRADAEERERLIDAEGKPFKDGPVQTGADEEDGDRAVEMEVVVESAA